MLSGVILLEHVSILMYRELLSKYVRTPFWYFIDTHSVYTEGGISSAPLKRIVSRHDCFHKITSRGSSLLPCCVPPSFLPSFLRLVFNSDFDIFFFFFYLFLSSHSLPSSFSSLTVSDLFSHYPFTTTRSESDRQYGSVQRATGQVSSMSTPLYHRQN